MAADNWKLVHQDDLNQRSEFMTLNDVVAALTKKADLGSTYARSHQPKNIESIEIKQHIVVSVF